MTDQLGASMLIAWGYTPRQCPFTGVYWWGHPKGKSFIGIFYPNSHVNHVGWFGIIELDKEKYRLTTRVVTFEKIDYSLLDAELMPLPEIEYREHIRNE